jgi:hypothetical protein
MDKNLTIFETWGKSPRAQNFTVSIFAHESGFVVEAGQFTWFTLKFEEIEEFLLRFRE